MAVYCVNGNFFYPGQSMFALALIFIVNVILSSSSSPSFPGYSLFIPKKKVYKD